MRFTPLVCVALVLSSCASKPAPADPKYVSELQEWRADRETRLKAPDGWLTLVGLFWIKEGTSTIGSNPSSDVPLPSKLPTKVGLIELKDVAGVSTPAHGVALKAGTPPSTTISPTFEPLKLSGA